MDSLIGDADGYQKNEAA